MWHIVYYDNGKQGIRFSTTHIVIKEEELTKEEWEALLYSVGGHLLDESKTEN